MMTGIPGSILQIKNSRCIIMIRAQGDWNEGVILSHTCIYLIATLLPTELGC